jgi:hypothetical protein
MRIFVGCEGEDEQGYVAFLARIAETRHAPVHLHSVLLRPGGGDHLALVEIAVEKIGENERKRERYQRKFIFVDRDLWGRKSERDDQTLRLAAENDIYLIWQNPCREAMMLRHIEGCQNKRPPDKQTSDKELRKHWPDYKKPMNATAIQQKLDEQSLVRIAAVEPDLRQLISLLGLLL